MQTKVQLPASDVFTKLEFLSAKFVFTYGVSHRRNNPIFVGHRIKNLGRSWKISEFEQILVIRCATSWESKHVHLDVTKKLLHSSFSVVVLKDFARGAKPFIPDRRIVSVFGFLLMFVCIYLFRRRWKTKKKRNSRLDSRKRRR